MTPVTNVYQFTPSVHHNDSVLVLTDFSDVEWTAVGLPLQPIQWRIQRGPRGHGPPYKLMSGIQDCEGASEHPLS